jgi:branched-chain amino acid transport system substrate-binding protein
MKRYQKAVGRSGLFCLLFTICLSLTFLFSGMPVQAKEVVKIGAVYPMSGGVAEAASWAIEGIKLAEEEVNDKGGITVGNKNLELEVVLYDSKCDPSPGVAAVEKMINRDKVIAISGDYCSSCTLAQREVSGRHKIVQVTPIAVNPKITSPGYPYMFRINNTIDMYAKPFVDFISKELKDVKKVAFLAITDDYGRSAVDIYTSLFPKNGIEVAAIEYFKHGDTDFYTQITKIVEKKPDAVYIVTDENAQNIGTLKQLRELGFEGKIFGCSTYATDDMVKLGGKELLEGMYLESPTFELIKNRPEVVAWGERYKAKFGREGNAFSLWGYNSIQLLASVIERADTLKDKEKIRKTMAETNLNNLLGYHGKPYFDKNGQSHPYMGVIQYQDGDRVVVYREKE